MPKKTFECAELANAVLITQAKGNQDTLKKQIAHGCGHQTSIDRHDDPLEKRHGRLEQRTYEVFEALPMLDKWRNDWPFIRHIIRVTRYREERKKNHKGPSQTVHYYVSNGALTASEYAVYIRQHWWIENKVNHVKDVAFREDKHTKRRNPYIYSTCIDMAINILKIKGVKNTKEALYTNSLDFNQMYNNFKNIL